MRLRAIALAVLFSVAMSPGRALPAPQTVQLVLAEKAPPPVTFGAEEIRRALERLGLKAFQTLRPLPADVTIYLGQNGDVRGARPRGKFPRSGGFALLRGNLAATESGIRNRKPRG